MLAGVGEGVRERKDERVGGSGRESNAAGLEEQRGKRCAGCMWEWV